MKQDPKTLVALRKHTPCAHRAQSLELTLLESSACAAPLVRIGMSCGPEWGDAPQIRPMGGCVRKVELKANSYSNRWC